MEQLTKCKFEVRYTCGTHKPRNCPHFEQNPNAITTLCIYGVPDCDCRNGEAQDAARRDWHRMTPHKE